MAIERHDWGAVFGGNSLVSAASRRQHALKGRFPGRRTLSAEEMWRTCFPDAQRDDVLECVALFAQEFRIDVGFLRPEDSLDVLFAPVPSMNPWHWLEFRGLEGDGVAEIAHQLYKRRKARGLPELRRAEVLTFGDLMRAWCEQPHL